MPRNPRPPRRLASNFLTRDVIQHLANPVSAYSRCESAAFVRKALTHAIEKDLVAVAEGVDLVPTSMATSRGVQFQRSNDLLRAVSSEQDRKRAAVAASAKLKNARTLFEQATNATEETRPILYYYGALSFMEFICLLIVRRERHGSPSHGLTVSCDSEGWEFDKNWPRNSCRVEMHSSGDFPFFVDALTVGGWPSYFSGYRLHQDNKRAPWEARRNPAPVFSNEKVSLDLLCNFDRDTYLTDNPAIVRWLEGTDRTMVWEITTLLMDFVVVYVASSLARYYIPAWQAIVEAEKSSVYNDIRTAFNSISEALPHFFRDKKPFEYSFETKAAY
jgi:hypothetical protein